MRILLTSHCDPTSIGGTQTWNRTVAKELESRGHEVTILGRDAHMWPKVDLAIVSQNTSFKKARAVADWVVFVSHGPGEFEMPPIQIDPPREPDCYAFVSEELQDGIAHASRQGWYRAHMGCAGLVRQPIDTDFWRVLSTKKPRLDVLRVSYHGGMDWLPALCDGMGKSFLHVKDEADPAKLRNLYTRAGVVIATGRSALEAMSCDRPVIIADQRPYNGDKPLGIADIHEAMKANYSARNGHVVTPSNLAPAIEQGGWKGGRDHVLTHHDSRQIVDQLLALVPVAA